MDAMTVVLMVLLVVIGAAAGFFLGRSNERNAKSAVTSADELARTTELGELRTELANARAETSRANELAATVRSELSRAQAEAARADTGRAEAAEQVANARANEQTARAELAGVQAQLRGAIAERDAALARVDEITADREKMVNQFKVLSSETLKEQGKTVEASAEQRLERTKAVMDPVQKSLIQLNERITQVERERAAISAQLNEQVRTVVATGETLRRETNALQTALRQPQVRGAWGEMQLKRVVELAGMVEHCDFYQQATTTTSADSKIRPDLKVMLGDEKFIYVDSKVPLAAFLDAQETDDLTLRAAKLKQFGGNVRSHVDQLSSKEYWKADSHSPEFVVLFIPSEALAAEALSQQPDLMEYAANKNIVLASPTSLIALLRAVAYGWRQAALADSAQEVFELGRELYARLNTMGGHFAKLGRTLDSSVQAYNSTMSSLETRVYVTARRFRDLQLTHDELPELKPAEKSVSSLRTPELIADAEQKELEARQRDSVRAVQEELDVLPSREPDVAELVDEQEPAGGSATLRELG